MRLLAVTGIKRSGKTTTLEHLIPELRRRGYSVASIKNIHCDNFTLDSDGTNTYRHKIAGSERVAALGNNETDMMYPSRLPIQELIAKFEDKYDFLLMEGVSDANVPMILTAHTTQEFDERWSDYVIAVSGQISSQFESYRNVPSIDATTNIKALVDLIEQKTYDRLPAFPPENCRKCGYSCAELGIAIIRGKAKRSDCVVDKDIVLMINGDRIMMVPTLQQILRNAIMGMVSPLDMPNKNAGIEIRLSI